MIFKLNLYELAHKSNGLFSNDMQNTWNQCPFHGDRLLEMAA